MLSRSRRIWRISDLPSSPHAGTAAYLRAHGLDVEVVFKINEGRPHVGDKLLNREIDLVVNTPLGRESFFDDIAVRRIAMMLSVPCVTTLTGAAATVSAIEALRSSDLAVRPLQDYHASAATRQVTAPFFTSGHTAGSLSLRKPVGLVARLLPGDI